jgi:hypothetical protein
MQVLAIASASYCKLVDYKVEYLELVPCAMRGLVADLFFKIVGCKIGDH